MGDLDGLAIRYASASPDQEKKQTHKNKKKNKKKTQKFWKRNVQLPKPLMCKPGTGIPTNSISFFTVTATTPDLQSPPNGSEAGFLFFPTSTAVKP